MPQSLSLVLPNTLASSTAEQQFLQQVQQVTAAGTSYGPTSQRPTTNLYIGQSYFDTTLDATVNWNGTSWSSGPASGTTSITAGNGIATETSGNTITISNTGVLSLAAGSGISLSSNTGNIIIASTGGGTSSYLTSVGLTMPTNTFTVTNTPITTNGNLTVTYNAQNPNYTLIAPDGASGYPTWRALVKDDIPWATPGYIGYLYPYPAIFTTVTVNTAINGTGFTNSVESFLLSPTPIGLLTPNQAEFTTVNAGLLISTTYKDYNNNLMFTSFPWTITSGAGSGATITSVNSLGCAVVPGTSSGNTIVLGIAINAPSAWMAQAQSATYGNSIYIVNSTNSINSVTLVAYSRTTNLAVNFTAGDYILVQTVPI